MTLLVIGGTGTLGRQIVRKALENGFQVRCIVRNKQAATFLKEWGAEIVYGDLTIPETLPLSFQGITALIDASTSRSEDDNRLIDVDWYGKLMLIEMAKRVNLKRFIFFSITNASSYPYINLMKQKENVEEVLENSGVPFTIFQCAGFYQALINQYAIPILEGKSVWTTEDPNKVSYIDTQDIADLTIKSLSIPETCNKKMVLAGKKGWCSAEIITLCETLAGQQANKKTIPIISLKLLRQITDLFEWSEKISERLSFVELLQNNLNIENAVDETYKSLHINGDDLLSLEQYLREYFEIMLTTLENVDVDSQAKQKDLII